MAKIELKKPVVEEISANIEGAQSVVLVQYCGLTVEQDTRLRKELRDNGVIYKVYKNTMMNFAFKGTDCESLAPQLEGPNAIAISKTDATAPARILAKFGKEAPALEIKGGISDGKAVSADDVKAIAELPTKDQLLGQIAGLISGFARDIAVCVNGVSSGLARSIQQVSEQKAA